MCNWITTHSELGTSFFVPKIKGQRCVKSMDKSKWKSNDTPAPTPENHDASRHIQTYPDNPGACVFLQQFGVQEMQDTWLRHFVPSSGTELERVAFDKQLELKLAATIRPSNSNTNLWITWKDPERSTSKSMRSLRSCFSALAEMQVRIFNQLCCGNSYPHQISSDWGPCMRRQLVRCPSEASVLYISPESPSPTALWATSFKVWTGEQRIQLSKASVSWCIMNLWVLWSIVLWCTVVTPMESQWHKPSGSIWGCINHPFMVTLITLQILQMVYNWCYHVLPHFINVIDVSSCTACPSCPLAHGAHGCAVGDTWPDLTFFLHVEIPVGSCCCMVIQIDPVMDMAWPCWDPLSTGN